MDFSQIPKVRNNTSRRELMIIERSVFENIPQLQNFTEDYEYIVELKKQLQDAVPDHVFFEVAIPLTILYLLIMILGVFGNAVTCIVIVRNSTMRNATNYYLFSLAISDLMLLIIGMILDFRYLWQTYPWAWGLTFCIGLHYGYSVAYNVSVLTVLAFSFERYLAVCHPLYFHSVSGLKRSIGFILTLWTVCALFSSIHFLRHLKKYVFELPSGSIIDTEKMVLCEMTYNLNIFAYEHLNFLIFFLLPIMVIIILYIKMAIKIRESSKTSSKLNSGQDSNFHRQLKSRRSTIRMLSVVVTVTFICWAPNSLLFLIDQTGRIQMLGYDDFHWVTYISDLFFYSSTVVNPIIYNLMSTRYREAFKKTLWGDKKTVIVRNDVKKYSTTQTPL